MRVCMAVCVCVCVCVRMHAWIVCVCVHERKKITSVWSSGCYAEIAPFYMMIANMFIRF